METLQMIGVAILGLGVLLSISFITFYLMKVLKILSDKYMSEKISLRIKDALDKVQFVVKTVVDADIHLYEEELKIALSDGKLEQKEMIAIAQKMADKTMEMITPDIETLKKYVVGTGLADFVLNMVKTYIKETIFKKVSNSIDPFVAKLNPETKSSENGVQQPPK